ncbi:MAG: HYR domain-containing protein [Bacteroidetes bacterium]|nr:HYR domain-containing protein [Bacteroidota bacterium]
MISANTIFPRFVLAFLLAATALLLMPFAAGNAQPVPSGTTLTVTTLIDEDDGDADPANGAGTSLREAILYSATGDLIDFDAGLTGSIFLTLGEIPITHNLFIEGPGVDVIEINGDDLVRLFNIDAASAVELSGLTLTSGREVDGGLIYSAGWLSITSSALRWSTAVQRGGAIYHDGDTLRLIGTRIEQCESFMHGGALAVLDGVLIIDASTLRSNTSGGNGGAVYLSGSDASLVDVTISGNISTSAGGAFSLSSTATASFIYSTLNDNRAFNGGAFANAGTLSLLNSTVSGNTADNSGGGIHNSGTLNTDFTTIGRNSAATGGGLATTGTANTMRTLYGENSAASGTDVSGAVSSGGWNLAVSADGSTGWIASDVTGTDDEPTVAALDDLRLNGGVTKTHALLVCSRAIDAADSSGSFWMTDQRGAVRTINGDNDNVARPDIGAFEVLTPLDISLPIVNGHPGFRVYLDASGNAILNPDTLLLGAYDNCGILSTNVSKTSFNCADTGYVNVTLTATDLSYNVTTKIIEVLVLDDTPPVLTPPTAVNMNAGSASCGVALTSAQLGTATATDNCGGIVITNNAPAFFPVGSTNVLWQAKDASDNIAVANQLVTILDVTLPTISAPADVTVSVQGNLCSVLRGQLVLGTPVVTDNCAFTISNNAPSAFPLGQTTVTWTAVDASGNTSTADQIVTVEDNTPPILYAPADLSLVTDLNSCVRDGANVDLGTPVASDNCSGVTVTNDKPASFPIGSTVVTWTATDGEGNFTTAQQTVTIFDGVPPTVVAPDNIEVAADVGSCFWTVDALVLGSATSQDNCSVPSVTNSAGTSLSVGTHRVIWTAVDAIGNRSTDVQIVTVVGEPPSINCVADMTVGTDPGKAGAVVTFAPPTASSGCTDIEIIRTDGLGSGDFFPVGTTTVAYMAIDGSNQIAVCSFDVTVKDYEDPQISVNVAPKNLWPADNKMYEIKATVEVWDNVPGATAVLTSITSNQNVNGDISGESIGVFDTNFELRAKRSGGPRVYTITYTATDVAGNTSTASATVTVPTQKPKEYEDLGLPAPSTLMLTQNYPNPFNPSTIISFGTPVEQHVELRVYNTMGMPVRTLVNTMLGAGTYTVEWDGRDDNGLPLSSGIYLYMLRSGSEHVHRKMILTR